MKNPLSAWSLPNLLLMVSLCFPLLAGAQGNQITYNPERDELDLATFMNMMNFDYHKFELKSSRPAYLNVYVEEYLNDQLINKYDHFSANRNEIPEAYFPVAFRKLDTSHFTLRIYTLSRGDSIEQIQFRIGDLGLFRKLAVNKKDFSYSWKLAGFDDNVGPLLEVGKKTPLLYYATAVEQNVDGNTVNAFCSVPNILDNRHLIENQGKIKHFFEVGLILLEKIE